MPRFGNKQTGSKTSAAAATSGSLLTINGTTTGERTMTCSTIQAARLRQAIHCCRQLLIKDLDPLDVIDAMSYTSYSALQFSTSATTILSTLRADTVRDSMLGVAVSREERVVAFLDRLDSICGGGGSGGGGSSANVEGSATVADTNSIGVVILMAFMAALRHNYWHVYAVLTETTRHIAEDDDGYIGLLNTDDIRSGEARSALDQRFRDQTPDDELAVTSNDILKDTRSSRERVAIPGETVRKMLKRLADDKVCRRKQRASNDGEDRRLSGSTAEILHDEVNGSLRASPSQKSDEYLDCFVVSTRGRLQREPYIHHASSQVNDVIQPEKETTYMAVLMKDLVFKRVKKSIIQFGDNHDVSSLSGINDDVYVVDEESLYSPVADHSPTAVSAAEQSQHVDEENVTTSSSATAQVTSNQQPTTTQNLQYSSVSTNRVSSHSMTSPPPLPPKPTNLPKKANTIPRTNPAATGDADNSTAQKVPSSPPIPARQQRMSSDVIPTSRSAKQPPPTPGEPETPLPDPPSIPTMVTSSEELEYKSEIDFDKVVEQNCDEVDEIVSSALNDIADEESKYEPIESPGTADAVDKLNDVVDTKALQLDKNTSEEDNATSIELKTVDQEVPLSAAAAAAGDAAQVVVIRRAQKTSESTDSDSESCQQDQQLETEGLQTVRARDSGIESILSSAGGSSGNGSNESPMSGRAGGVTSSTHLSGHSQRIHNGEAPDSFKSGRQTELLTAAPSLSDIVIGVEDNEEEYKQRCTQQSTTTTSVTDGRIRSSFINDEDCSYYEDIDLLEGSSSPKGQGHRSTGYLDPRSTSFTSADSFYFRRRGTPSGVVMRRTSSKAPPHPPPPAPRSLPVSSMAIFMNPQGDKKVLPAGTLLVAQEETSGDSSHGVSDKTVVCFDREGLTYCIPADALGRHGDPTNEIWFYPVPLTVREATMFLQRENQRGCFLVYRPRSSKEPFDRDAGNGNHQAPAAHVYNLSVCLGKGGDVVHYPIVRNPCGDVAVHGHDHSFMTLTELVTYFRRNQSRLAVRLGRSLREAQLPIVAGAQYPARFEIARSELRLGGEFGRGRLGPVCIGRYRNGSTGPNSSRWDPVVVKVLKPEVADSCGICGPEVDDEFLEEAKVLMSLHHENVARLIGVSFSCRPFYLIVEWTDYGTLADCLRSGFYTHIDDSRTLNVTTASIKSTSAGCDIDVRFDICVQIVSALLYLESRRYVIHRSVAARNVIVCSDDGGGPLVKLTGFDLARLVSDDEYRADPSEPVAVRWAAPEVLVESRYSTKSDVWALGVLFWEVFADGIEPYAEMDCRRTAVYVAEGGRLNRPNRCPSEIYAMMRRLWRPEPDDRPTFADLHAQICGESSVYYTCSPLSPSSTVTSHPAIRSASDDDRPVLPPPLPMSTRSGRQSSASRTLPMFSLPFRTGKSSPSNASQGQGNDSKVSGTPASRRQFIDQSSPSGVNRSSSSKRREKSSSRTPSAVRGGSVTAIATGNATSSDESPMASASASNVTGYSVEDAIAAAAAAVAEAADDLTRGEKIRKSLRKLMPNSKKTPKYTS